MPGSAVPDDADNGKDSDWQAYVLQNFGSVAHPIGTASMMRRELGGAFFPSSPLRFSSLLNRRDPPRASRCRRRVLESVRHEERARCGRVYLPDAAQRAYKLDGVWCGGEGSRHHQGGVP